MISPFFSHAFSAKTLLCFVVLWIAAPSVWVPLTVVDAVICQAQGGALAHATPFWPLGQPC